VNRVLVRSPFIAIFAPLYINRQTEETIMFIFLVILSCIAGLLLIGAVLIQPGKGDMAAGFGGVGGQFGSMIGMRRAADFIVKTTIGLALAILVFAIAANTVFKPVKEEAASPFENIETGSSAAPAPASAPAPAPAPAPASAPAQQAAPAGK
jgi:protein translocase SecG subunit